VTRRRGFSLPEVMVATFVLAVVLLPVLFMFMSSTGGAGQDVRELKATLLAQEILEGVIAAQRQKAELHALPPENDAGQGEKELDLEALIEAHAGEEGVPLYMGKCNPRLTRMYLSPKQNNFKRFLAISPEKAGKDRGTALTTPVLWRVTARVKFTTPGAAREVTKDLVLTTFLYMDPAPAVDNGDDEL
jgi:prepilin-type N-terminal cleavage/methylation domain-containing protein